MREKKFHFRFFDYKDQKVRTAMFPALCFGELRALGLREKGGRHRRGAKTRGREMP